jgi:uncharacterized protein YjbI with pentapeptide repeats
MSNGLQKLTQSELDEIIRKHLKFISGIRGGARAIIKFKDISGLTFRKADLSQSDFTGSVLVGCDMSYGNFKGVSFFACDLRGANLEHACFARADLRGATVVGAKLTGADFQKADLREGIILNRVGTDNAGLADSYYGESKKAKTIFAGARLAETNMSGAMGRDTDFTDADLTGVIIKDADFSNANFHGANLTGADFTGSDLKNANLKSSVISGTIMTDTKTEGMDTTDAISEEKMGAKLESLGKTLPQLLEEHTSWITSAGRKGARLDLSGFDLRHILDLRAYSLTAVKAIGAMFINQNLEGINAQSASFDRADFRDSVMKKVDMRGSSLKNAMMTRVNMVGANFSPLLFKNPDGTNRLQRVNLTGANLRYAIMTDANLSDCILNGVDLSYAVLHGVDLRRADLTGAILDNADFHGAILTDVISDKPING